MDKIIKCRKPKQSDCCGRIIEKGEMYNKFTLRTPKYNNEDIQVGIEYLEIHICIDCYNKQKERMDKCASGNHEFSNIISSYWSDGAQYPVFGDYTCIHCGVVQS